MTSPDPTEHPPPPLPDRLSIEAGSPHFLPEVFEHDVGIRFNGKDRADVEEYCISEGWIKVPVKQDARPQGQAIAAQVEGPGRGVLPLARRRPRQPTAMNAMNAMNATTISLFALVALVAIATPGPTVLLALANGSRHGVRRSLPGMFGAVMSDVVLVGAVALGLGALLAASEFWFSCVKWVGAGYLAWLGLRLLRSKGGLDLTRLDADHADAAPRRIFMKSFLVAVTNPKGYLFCSALLPQFIDASVPQWPQYMVIGLVFAGIDFSVMLGYALIGARAVSLLRRRTVLWLDRTCGAALLAIAGSLALYRRGSS